MAAEHGEPRQHYDVGMPAAYEWQSLTTKRRAQFDARYGMLVRELGTTRAMHRQTFTLGVGVNAKIYDGLREKNAEDTTSSAAQYFTSSAPIRPTVKSIGSKPDKRKDEPACGIVRSFLPAHDSVTYKANLAHDRDQIACLNHNILEDSRVDFHRRLPCQKTTAGEISKKRRRASLLGRVSSRPLTTPPRVQRTVSCLHPRRLPAPAPRRSDFVPNRRRVNEMAVYLRPLATSVPNRP